MENLTATIQDKFLEILCVRKIKASIYLMNGIRLEGYIQAFDQNTLILRGVQTPLIYKRIICSILPLQPLPELEEAGTTTTSQAI